LCTPLALVVVSVIFFRGSFRRPEIRHHLIPHGRRWLSLSVRSQLAGPTSVSFKGGGGCGTILAAEALAGYSGEGVLTSESMAVTPTTWHICSHGRPPYRLSFGVVSSALSRIFWFWVSALIVVAGLLTQSRGEAYLRLQRSRSTARVGGPLRVSVVTRQGASGRDSGTLLAVLLTVAA